MRLIALAIGAAFLLAAASTVAAEGKPAKLPFSVDDEKKFIEAGMIIEYHCFQVSYLGSGPKSPYTEYQFVLSTDAKGFGCERWTVGWDGRMFGGIRCSSGMVRHEWGELEARLPAESTEIGSTKPIKITVDDVELEPTLYSKPRDKKGSESTRERLALHKDFAGVPLQYSVYSVSDEWRATLHSVLKGEEARRWRERYLPTSPWTAAEAAKFLVKDLSWSYKVSGPNKGSVTYKVTDADDTSFELEQITVLGDTTETTRVKRRFADAAPFVPCLFTSVKKRFVKATVNGKETACREFTMTSKSGGGWPQVWVAVTDMPLIYASKRNQTKAAPSDDDELWELEAVNVPKKK